MIGSNHTDEERALFAEMFDAVMAGDEEKSVAAAEAALEAGVSPLTSIEEGLTPGIREVGDRFGRMEMFLPEMVLSARAMQAAVDVLEPYFADDESITKGKVIIGTVKGDIHDIGKNIARALLTVNGYEVIDLGRDVALTDFIDVAETEGADVIGMSGLLSTSLPLMRDTIKMMHDDEVRDKYHVIIGGGPTSQEYADEIGADGYAETAFDGVDLCDRLLGVESN
ncbi:MAG: corrinoid protein [Acidimicrobiia bacterium]|nr:MAG: corrinoid protein [Acidimicrobiia bacterium]